MEKIFIVIPAFNEERKIADVIRKLKAHGYGNIIVVDDGSGDKTYATAKKSGAITLRHILNRGLGGALGTGFEEALSRGADIIITFDADGQHDVRDIKKLIEPLLKSEADVAIGSRLRKGYMPMSRKIGNFGLNVATFMLFGVWCTDTQSGLRAFTRGALKKLDIKANRMEVSSEIVSEIGRNSLKLKEVPIRAVYTKYSLRKGQGIYGGVKIMSKLLAKRFMDELKW